MSMKYHKFQRVLNSKSLFYKAAVICLVGGGGGPLIRDYGRSYSLVTIALLSKAYVIRP